MVKGELSHAHYRELFGVGSCFIAMANQKLEIRNLSVYAAEGRWQDIVVVSTSGQVNRIGRTDASLLVGEFAYYGKEMLVETFLNRQGDPNFRCLDVPERIIFASVFESYPGSTPIGQTVLGRHQGRFDTTQTLKLLLRSGADPNVHTYSGYTPLQLSIVMDCRDHARILLEHEEINGEINGVGSLYAVNRGQAYGYEVW